MNCSRVKCPVWLSDLMHEAGGTVPFSQFMDWALNETQYGSYSSGKLRIGKTGDFVTSPSLGPEFCELLSIQISEWIIEIESNCNKHSTISIIDIGPGEGDLTYYLIAALEASFPHLLSNIEFVLVEINDGMRMRQKKKLMPFNNVKIRWSNFGELSTNPVTGIMIAHEILDALPVDRIVWLNNKLYLQCVKLINHLDANYLELINSKLTGKVNNFLNLAKKQLGIQIPPKNPRNGWSSELHTHLNDWFKLASSCLLNGPLLIIDYAMEARRYYQTSRFEGTLISYRNQKASNNILADPGLSDITSHLCLETLNLIAENNNFKFIGERRQGLSLLSLGLSEKLNSIQSSASDNLELALSRRENLLRLVDPICLGEFRWIMYDKPSKKATSNNSLPLFLLDPLD